MPDYVSRPVPGAQAFRETDRPAELSQAAQLLIIRSEVRGDRTAYEGRQRFQESPFRGEFYGEADDRAALQVPSVTNRNGLRFSRREIQRALETGDYLRSLPGGETIAIVAEVFHREPTVQHAALLLETCLSSPSEIVRVSAAAAYFELTLEPGELIVILGRGTQSSDPLVREVSATALVHIFPESPQLLRLIPPDSAGGLPQVMTTSLLIHGTWAKTEQWWQPEGDFHTYILSSVRTDLYNKPDRFSWSGGYSDAARSLGGQQLFAWLSDHQAKEPSLIAHSHGGSVAMLTTHFKGMNVKELILLSCPVHLSKYAPNFAQIGKVVSIRVKMDLVILADGGGQRFGHPEITEHVLPVWFDHSATHEPEVWQDNDVPAML